MEQVEKDYKERPINDEVREALKNLKMIQAQLVRSPLHTHQRGQTGVETLLSQPDAKRFNCSRYPANATTQRCGSLIVGPAYISKPAGVVRISLRSTYPNVDRC